MDQTKRLGLASLGMAFATGCLALASGSQGSTAGAGDGGGTGVGSASGTTTGTGYSGCLAAEPNPLDLGNTFINTTSKKSVTLINKCSAPVNALTAVLAGSDADLFQVLDAPTSLAANAESTVDISYAPLALETRSVASLVFVGGDGEQAQLSLFGEPVGVALTLAPNPINFGSPVGAVVRRSAARRSPSPSGRPSTTRLRPSHSSAPTPARLSRA